MGIHLPFWLKEKGPESMLVGTSPNFHTLKIQMLTEWKNMFQWQTLMVEEANLDTQEIMLWTTWFKNQIHHIE